VDQPRAFRGRHDARHPERAVAERLAVRAERPLVDLAQHEVGGDDGHGHAAGGDLDAQGLVEAHQRMLARRIGRSFRYAREPRQAGDRDDEAACAHELRQRRGRQPHVAVEIEPHQLFEYPEVGQCVEAAPHGAARVGDEHVERAEACDGGRDERLAGRAIGDVRRHRCSFGTEGTTLGRNRFEPPGVAGGQREPRPLAGERQCEGAADPLRGPGDQDGLAAEAHGGNATTRRGEPLSLRGCPSRPA